MAKKKTKKNKWYKGLFSKLIVVFIIGLNIWFTVEVLEVVKSSGTEPTALVAAFFGFTTGELWMLSSMKKNKDKIKCELELSNDE